jgi:hypothetical protein
VCVAIIGQNLASMNDWSLATWLVTVVLACYVVGAFVELARSFARTELAVLDGDLVLFAPTLLRTPVRIPRDAVASALVTPNGWFAYAGRVPYSSGDTAAVTADRPDLGSNIRAVLELTTPLALPWRRIPGPRGDLCRGRSMPRAASRIVFGTANGDLEQLEALLSSFMGTSLPHTTVDPDGRRRDVHVTRTRLAAAACVLLLVPFVPHARKDPLHDLSLGVCLNAPASPTFSHLDVQSCAKPHDAEVVGFTHEAQVSTVANRDCVSQYSTYAGADPTHSAVKVQVLHHAGSDDGVCIAVTLQPIEYSLRGTTATNA